MAGTQGPPGAPGDVATVASGRPGAGRPVDDRPSRPASRPSWRRPKPLDRIAVEIRAPAGARRRRAGRPICLDRRRARGGPRPGPGVGRRRCTGSRRVRTWSCSIARSPPPPWPGPRDATVGRSAARRSPLAYGAFLERLMAAYEGLLEDPAVRAVAGRRARHRPADRAGRPGRRDPRGHPADARRCPPPPPGGSRASRPGTRPTTPASGDDQRDPVGAARRPRPARRAVRPRRHRPIRVGRPTSAASRSTSATPAAASTRTSLASSVLSGGPDPRGETRPPRRPDRDRAPVRGRPRRTRRAGRHAVPARRSRRLADRYCWTPMARAEARGVDGAWLDAPVRVRARARRGPVPRRRCRGVAGPPRRRAGSVRGGPRRRPVGGPARELPAVRRASLRLFRPLCRTRRLHPHPCRRTRSRRSASACSARPMRSWPRARTLDRVAPDRPAGVGMTRIVHLSDFHFDGSPELRRALRSLVDSAIAREPDLVVVTGDLSADGRPAELDEVARELARFGADPAGRPPRQPRPRAVGGAARARRGRCRSIRTSTTSWRSSRR